jgi:hypothetical protein
MSVWIYVDTRKQKERRRTMAHRDQVQRWFAEHDAEGVAFEYEVLR